MRLLARRFRTPIALAATVLVTMVMLVATPPSASAAVRPATRPAPTLGTRALAVARHQIGKPYRWGAAGPWAFDCSGLTQYSYARVGRRLPHNALAQYRSVRHVRLSQLRPGDLVFMNMSGGGPGGISHVGIYAGHGNWVVARMPGTRITIQHIWTHRGVYAGRP